MDINNQSGRKYLSNVKRHLKCSAETRNRFLETLALELHNFELETPDAGYADYIAAFDEPKTAAQRYLDELSDKEIFGYWKRIIAVVMIAVLAVLALMIGCFFTHRKMRDVPTYYVSAGDTSYSDMQQSAAAEG